MLGSISDIRTVFRVAALGLVLAAAGCQSGGDAADTASGADVLPPGKVSEAELRAYCPAVSLREGTATYATYERGAEPGDRSKIVYQASITDVTRRCARADGSLTITVAVAGRVIPGPVGSAGTVTLPIRVVALRGSEVVYTRLHQHQVAVGEAATQFIFSDPAVTMPIPDEGTVQVFAGFDEGPPQD